MRINKESLVQNICIRLRPSRNPSFVSGKTGVLNRFWTKIEEIYAVMKDESPIKLDLTGADATILQAQTPIVLSQLDYILLEDGTKLFAPSI